MSAGPAASARGAGAAHGPALRPKASARAGRRTPLLVAGAGLLLVAYPLLVSASFWQNVGVLALTFAIAAVGWNLIGGFTGQISFGQAVFFASGAYATALLVRSGWSPWPAMAVGAVAAAVLSAVIGYPTFRLRGHYFAIATIAAGEIARAVVDNNEALGGVRGLTIPISGESGLWALQFSIRDKTPYYLVALGLFAAASLAMWLLIRGRAGSYFRAIRDDQEAAAAAGIPVRRYKLYAFAASAMLTSVAGSFYAMYVGFVDPPSTLALSLSISIALVAVLGGSGALWGPLLGAWALTAMREVSRTEFSGSGSAADLVLFSAAIICVALFEPAGLVGVLRRLERLARRAARSREAAA
jgi:branched-chain amino acid transport system permease protein